jgi:hypothetical protein
MASPDYAAQYQQAASAAEVDRAREVVDSARRAANSSQMTPYGLAEFFAAVEEAPMLSPLDAITSRLTHT